MLNFEKYLLYDEITNLLQTWAKTYPQYASLNSIGKSYEGRNVWAMTITNIETGAPETKPAMYIDGNIHAGEVTGSMAALHLINTLLTSSEEKIKTLLDTKTFYILPRINPDGAELYLTTATKLRSSVRPYPTYRKDEDPAGLHAEDINGDGRILLMRIRDDKHGAWKISHQDNRMMIKRSPFDFNGPFYHVYTEGVLKNDKGELANEVKYPFESIDTKYGLDLNRNFPAGYSPHTPGSGPFPLSEPETRNQVEFIDRHNNIAGVLLYHTTGGVLFRPHSTIADKNFAKSDLAMYEVLGDIGTQVTGYPVICCYGDIWSGVLDDWCFEAKGLYAFTPELWDAVGRAAPELKKKFMKKMSKEEEQQLELKLLQWNDKELMGKGFINWHTVDHPQLGKVEVGGWKIKDCRQNPPLKFLEQECYKMTQFSLSYALSLPQVHIDETEVTKIENNVYEIEALVSNHGYMGTSISEQAQKQKAVREDLVRISLTDTAKLLSGTLQTNIGYLQGFSAGQQKRSYYFGKPAHCAKRLKWLVKFTDECEKKVRITVVSERGGIKEKEVVIE
ncbi:carboxypeptidase [Clostridium sp. 'deep sea']|uniref:M14 family metallopeptidase n=1 Tax=Clostridium sp. 'deep sea' TaxID=2779445 RepID=UPI0018968A61|nr:M14 family metallopeptidase [Clostridium sp. 'deep sea']QOR36084.1 carboxypeptidase [Clostridium sp. 'deep sea']